MRRLTEIKRTDQEGLIPFTLRKHNSRCFIWFKLVLHPRPKSGYWQLEVEEQDHEKTAFTAGNGFWQLNVMAFALCNAPMTFQQLMDNILGDLRYFVYLDDMIAHTITFKLELCLTRIFSQLRVANLKLNPSSAGSSPWACCKQGRGCHRP